MQAAGEEVPTAPGAPTGSMVVVERPPAGLAQGRFPASTTFVVLLGAAFVALGLGQVLVRVVRWARGRSEASHS